MTGEKFHFFTGFFLSGKNANTLVSRNIFNFGFCSVKQKLTKAIGQRNHPLSVRDMFNFQIVSSSFVFVLTARTSQTSLGKKTQFLNVLFR